MMLVLRELFVFAAPLLFHGAAMELHGAMPDWLASHLLRDVGSSSDQAVSLGWPVEQLASHVRGNNVACTSRGQS